MKLIITMILLGISQVTLSQDTIQKTQNMNNMKTPFLGLRTVVYKVGDLNKAKNWYSTAFQTKPYFDEPYYVGFSIGGYELGLLPMEDTIANKSESVIAYWGVDNIDKEYNRIIELGGVEHEKPTNYGGDLMIASVKDPWGNLVGLIYNPDFKLETQIK